MKLNVEELGREAGFGEELRLGSETPPGYFDSLPLLEAFARLIVERCAVVCEDQSQEYEQYTGHPRLLQYQCAEAVRNLLEAE